MARSSILDPYFAHSVVLMVPLPDTDLVVGLIVNKPAPPPLIKILQQTPVLKDRTAIAYFGGPVDMTDISVAFHSAKPPKTAIPLYDDVYLSLDEDFVLKLLQDPKQSGELRLFLGRSQWAPEQLQGEALIGSWYSLRAEGGLIFDRETKTLWERMHQRARPGLSTENRQARDFSSFR